MTSRHHTHPDSPSRRELSLEDDAGLPRDLDSLMARLREGDRRAFPAVDQLLRPPLERLCRSLLPSSADADDATQNALEKILFRAATYDPERPALPWALSIGIYECRTLRRRQQRRNEVPELQAEELEARDGVESTNAEEQLVHSDQTAALRLVMGELSELDQETLIGAFWREDVGGTTFRKRKQRALSRLRELWGALYGE